MYLFIIHTSQIDDSDEFKSEIIGKMTRISRARLPPSRTRSESRQPGPIDHCWPITISLRVVRRAGFPGLCDPPRPLGAPSARAPAARSGSLGPRSFGLGLAPHAGSLARLVTAGQLPSLFPGTPKSCLFPAVALGAGVSGCLLVVGTGCCRSLPVHRREQVLET